MMEPNTTVLVIDDEPINFDVIESILAHSGVTLYYRSTGYKIIEALEQTRAELLLLDVLMPGVDGVEVCKIIRADPNWQTLPIIVVTALSDKNDLARCLDAGADDFVSKPINSQELRARVKALMRIHTQYKEIGRLIQTQRNTIALLRNTLRSAERTQHPILNRKSGTILSHELNTPLNGILGPLRLILDEGNTLAEDERRSFLSDVEYSAIQLHQNIRRLLIYLELENNQSESRANFSLGHGSVSEDYVLDIVNHLPYPREEKEKAEISVEPHDIDMDVYELEIILSELLDNAFKYSIEEANARLVGQRVAHGYNLSIAYVGESQLLCDVFQGNEPLEQLQVDPFRNGGHGLGLYNAKRLLDRKQVATTLTVDADSSSTTVSFTLPVYIA